MLDHRALESCDSCDSTPARTVQPYDKLGTQYLVAEIAHALALCSALLPSEEPETRTDGSSRRRWSSLAGASQPQRVRPGVPRRHAPRECPPPQGDKLRTRRREDAPGHWNSRCQPWERDSLDRKATARSHRPRETQGRSTPVDARTPAILQRPRCDSAHKLHWPPLDPAL